MRKLLLFLFVVLSLSLGAGSASASNPDNPWIGPEGIGGTDGPSIEDYDNYWHLWQPGDSYGDLICGENPLGGLPCPGDDEGIEGMPGEFEGDPMPPILLGPTVLFPAPDEDDSDGPADRTIVTQPWLPGEGIIIMPAFEPNPNYVTDDSGWYDDSAPAQDVSGGDGSDSGGDNVTAFYGTDY